MIEMREKKGKKQDKRHLPLAVKMTVKVSHDKKGEDINVLDLREISSFTDYFIIMHGNSSRQNLALYKRIDEELMKKSIKPLHVEGRESAEWILMDYGSFVIHIFSMKAREFYSLEKLWGDAPRYNY